MHKLNVSVAVDNNGVRQGTIAIAIVFGDFNRVVFTDKHGIVNAVGIHEVLYFFCCVDGNTDKLQASGAVFFLHFDEHGCFSATGRTPGSPKIKDDYFAIPFMGITQGAVHVRQAESRGRSIDHGLCCLAPLGVTGYLINEYTPTPDADHEGQQVCGVFQQLFFLWCVAGHLFVVFGLAERFFHMLTEGVSFHKAYHTIAAAFFTIDSKKENGGWAEDAEFFHQCLVDVIISGDISL